MAFSLSYSQNYRLKSVSLISAQRANRKKYIAIYRKENVIIFKERYLVHIEKGGLDMTEANIKIEGMSCQHCVMAVKKAIGGLKGIENADVMIGSAVVRYDESKVKKEDIEAAVENAGFKVSRSSK